MFKLVQAQRCRLMCSQNDVVKLAHELNEVKEAE